jgi:hypothetical protein
VNDDERVEGVARAIYDEHATGQPTMPDWESVQPAFMRYAAAAIAALPQSPAEEAVKRVEAVVERITRMAAHHEKESASVRDLDLRYTHQGLGRGYRAVVEELRAALASPAPVPQECGSRGPRIGSEGKPICRLPLGHAGSHAPSADDGWGDMSWSDPPLDRQHRVASQRLAQIPEAYR